MAFSLGTLFVDLVLNSASFMSGMDKASVSAKRTGKDIERGLSSIGASLSSLGGIGDRIGSILDGVGSKARAAFDVAANKGRGLGTLMAGSVLGGVTALAGGMFALAEHAAEVGSKIYEASEKTGIGAVQMSGLMAIAKETKGDFDGLTTALARAGSNLSGLYEKGDKATESTKFLARAAKAAGDDGMKPMGDRIQAVLAQIFKFNDVGDRNKALSELLGKGWMNNVDELKLLAEQGYGPMIEQAKKLGVYFDANAAAQAKQFSIAIAALKAEFSGVGIALGTQAIPYLKEFVANMAGAIPALEAFGLRVLAIEAAWTGVGLPLAISLWREAGKKLGEANEITNQFLINAERLAQGEKHSAEETEKLNTVLKMDRDILAELIRHETDQLAALNASSKPLQAITLEYKRTVAEIDKAVAAGGSYAESLTAQALAAEIFAKKLSQIPAVIPKSLPWGEVARAAIGTPPAPPLPSAESAPPGISGGPATLPAFQSIDDLAKARAAMDSTRGYERALREESELSGGALARLAQQFHGMTVYEIAATVEGRRFVEQMTALDRVDAFGKLSDKFSMLKNTLIAEGTDLGGQMTRIMGRSINGIEDQLAQLLTTGRANFRQLAQSIQAEMTKAVLQKGVASLLSHLGMTQAKRDGSTASSGLYVIPVGETGLGVKGLGLGDKAKPDSTSPDTDSSNSGLFSKLDGMFSPLFGKLGSTFSSLFSSIGSIAKGLGGIFGGFGGFLAGGGDVTPGKAYVVGERHPELFIPGASGRVVPTITAQSQRPLVYSPVYQISTPDADSFRRSQSQLISEGYTRMRIANMRNG